MKKENTFIIKVIVPSLKRNQAIFFLNKNQTKRPLGIDGGYYESVFVFSSLQNAAGRKKDFDRNGGIISLTLIDPSDIILCLMLEFDDMYNTDEATINHYFVGQYATVHNIYNDVKVIYSNIYPQPTTCRLLKSNVIKLKSSQVQNKSKIY